MSDPEFQPDASSLVAGVREALSEHDKVDLAALPDTLPAEGIGGDAALSLLAPIVLGGAQRLGERSAFAHMDPPTPWVTWVTALWNASLNQNLLHPDLSPVATRAERLVVEWLAPFFGMSGGHMTPGSSVSNLSALWAAREVAGVRKVVGSAGAHLSIPKAAHILGLEYQSVPVDSSGAMDAHSLPEDLDRVAFVLTAGATSTGAIDPLSLAGRAAWTHVDAAWSGPLRLTKTYAGLLDGIEKADSLSISAHKWLFQPKESALVLFRDVASAHAAISFGGAYLATPNVGVLGSHGAAAIPLLATLISWGRKGLSVRLDAAMAAAAELHASLSSDPRVIVFGAPQSGVLLWRPRNGSAREIRVLMPDGMTSLTTIDKQDWVRQVAANPMVDIDEVLAAISQALSG